MNDATRLLRNVAATGVKPTAKEISDVLHGGTRNERNTAAKGVEIAAGRIQQILLNARDFGADVPSEITAVIDEVTDKYSHVVGIDKGQDGPTSSREHARAILANEGSDDRERRLAAARESKRIREPLRELLTLAGPGRGVDPRDIDTLVLRGDLTAEQVSAFRAEVQKQGDRIAKVHREGNHSASRAIAEEVAVKLSDKLAPAASHRDPHRDTTDPRVLADAIKNRP